MGLSHYPNGISSFGVPVIGSGHDIPVTTGKYFFVSSLVGNAGNSGLTPEFPLNTITNALLKCTANKGDVIIVMPGHASTISAASGLDLNKAGVTIIGLGNGSLKPTVTLDTAATATIAVSAANITVKNITFTANFADIATCFLVGAKDFRIENCEFNEAAIDMNWLTCIKTNATDNACDGLTVLSCIRRSIDAAALAFISILGNCDRLTVAQNWDNQASAADVGHFIIKAAKVCLGMRILGNVLTLNGDNNAQTVAVFMTGSSTTDTGVIAYNLIKDLDATTELFDTAAAGNLVGHFENYQSGAANKSGYLLPAADS